MIESPIISRERYLDRLIRKRWNGMVKVITGLRGCGKSFLLFYLFKNRLLAEGVPEDHIIGIALDDPRSPELREGRALFEHIASMMSDDDDHYILLDDIQLVSGFENVLNTLLRLHNVDIYVTGRESRSLSSNVITEFRGRGDEVRLYPLSFGEFVSVHDGPEDKAWQEYLAYGGMPALLGMIDPTDKMACLKRLASEMHHIFKGGHDRIGDESELEDMLKLLYSSIGSTTNPHRIADALASEGSRGSTESRISEYMGALEDAFLFERVRRYDVRRKVYLDSSFKYYPVDIGLSNVWLGPGGPEHACLMECAIYIELRSRGFSVDVGLVREHTVSDGVRMSVSHEIDFIANIGSRRYYIQTGNVMEGPEERKAEIRPFLEVRDSFRKILVVGGNGEPIYDDHGVMTVGIRRFLLDESLMQNRRWWRLVLVFTKIIMPARWQKWKLNHNGTRN